MKFLLDTDIIVDYLRARTRLQKEFLERGAGISIITLGELIYGAYKSSHPQNSLGLTFSFIKDAQLQIVELSEEIIYSFGKLKADLEQKGKRLEDFDLLIAATAKANDMTLVTHNKKHFERIPDLQITS